MCCCCCCCCSGCCCGLLSGPCFIWYLQLLLTRTMSLVFSFPAPSATCGCVCAHSPRITLTEWRHHSRNVFVPRGRCWDVARTPFSRGVLCRAVLYSLPAVTLCPAHQSVNTTSSLAQSIHLPTHSDQTKRNILYSKHMSHFLQQL